MEVSGIQQYLQRWHIPGNHFSGSSWQTWGVLWHFTRIPLIPKEGEYFKFRNIVNHAFKPEYADAMMEIFKPCSSMMYETKCDFFGTYLDPADPLLELLKEFRPHLKTE
ncbi:hypothetical protein [Methanomethylovorans sp.]|uniref:hypothetical protein n=1 Tax=Methanomethylovorans sp. TaxID=2758717 RepID=UPI00351CB6D2